MAVYDYAGRGEVYPESQEGLLDTLVATKSPEEIERMRLALGAAGVVNPAADALEGAIAYKQGDTLGTALALGSMLLPIPLGMVLGRGGRGAKAAGLTDDILAGFRPNPDDLTDVITRGRKEGQYGLRQIYSPESSDFNRDAYYSGEKPWLSYLHSQADEFSPGAPWADMDPVREMYRSLDDDVIASMRHKFSERPDLFEGVTMLDERTPMPLSHFYTDMGQAVGREGLGGGEVFEKIAREGLAPQDSAGLSWVSGHPNFLEGVMGTEPSGQNLGGIADGLESMWGKDRYVAGRFNDLLMRPAGTVFDPFYKPHQAEYLDALKTRAGDSSQAWDDLNIIEEIDDGKTASTWGYGGGQNENLVGLHNLDPDAYVARQADPDLANESMLAKIQNQEVNTDYGYDHFASDHDAIMDMKYEEGLYDLDDAEDYFPNEATDELAQAVTAEEQAGEAFKSGSIESFLDSVVEGHAETRKGLSVSHQLTDSFKPIQEIIEGNHRNSNKIISFPQEWINRTQQRLSHPALRKGLSDEQIEIYEKAIGGEKITWKEFYSITYPGLRSFTKKIDRAKYSKILQLEEDFLRGGASSGPGEAKLKEARKWFEQNPDQEPLNPMFFSGRDDNYLLPKLFAPADYLDEAIEVNRFSDPSATSAMRSDATHLERIGDPSQWKYQEQMYHNVENKFGGGLRQLEPGGIPWAGAEGPDRTLFENFAVPSGTRFKSASGTFLPMPGFDYGKDMGKITGVETVRIPSVGDNLRGGRYKWTKALEGKNWGPLSLLASMPGAGYLVHQMSRDDRPGGA